MKTFEEFFRDLISETNQHLAYDNKDAKTVRRFYEQRKESMKEAWDFQQKEIDSLKKQNEILRECAEFYRDENRESWSYDQSSQKCPAMLNGDDIEWCEKEKGFRGGMVARQALAEVEKMKEKV